MPDTITGKKFVILGGSSGIGFSVAKLVLEQGAGEVIIGSSNETRVNDAVSRLKSASKTGGKVSGKTLDMRDIDNIPAFFKDIGNFDHLVSTAGGSLPQKKFPDEIDLKDVMAGSSDRYWSVLKAIQCSYKQINQGGSITLTSGTTVVRPLPGWSPLSGVAGAIETATRNLALDMAPLRVNCVVPGAVDTELWGSMPEQMRQEYFKSLANKLPAAHVGTPEEIAEAYVFCFRCTYLTGESIFVDGGGRLV